MTDVECVPDNRLAVREFHRIPDAALRGSGVVRKLQGPRDGNHPFTTATALPFD